MTLISRILGFVRDSVIAAAFGATAAADAFFVAFRIPNLFRRLFAEGAFAQAFVPVLTNYRANQDEAEVIRLVNAASGALGAALLVFVMIGILAAPFLIAIFAPGFTHGTPKFALSVELLRLTFPYLLFISLTALFGGVLNTYGRFSIPAITPALLNLSMISAVIFLAPHLDRPVFALAWGVTLGGVLQLGLQLHAVARLGMLRFPSVDWTHPGVRRVLTLMGPAVFGVSVAQINLLVDTLIASFLIEGSISWLYYSDRLMEFPLGIFGIALGTVILPSLSEHHAKGRPEAFSDTLDWGLRLACVITIPATVGLATLAGPMLSSLFQYGVMTEHDVVMSTRSLVTYASGLTGFVLVKILAPGFYARQDIKTPVKIGVFAMCTNVLLNLILVGPLAHAGLALATSLSAFINSGLLLRLLLLNGAYRPRPGWWPLLLRIALASVLMGVLLAWGAGGVAVWTERTALERLIALLLWITAGGMTYVVALFVFGMRPKHMSQPVSRV